MPRPIQAFVAVSLVAGILPAVAPLAQAGGDLLEGKAAFGDWRTNSPGTRRLIRPQDLPAPNPAASARNFAVNVDRTEAQKPSVPAGFAVNLFASGLAGPRLIRVAPDGDVFVAESSAGRIVVLRPSGETTPQSSVFAAALSGPFGIAFYPPGPDPEWV